MQIKTKATSVFGWLCDTQKRINILVGGAGSSKSYSIGQHILLNIACQEKHKRILIIRKTLPSLRRSAFTLIIDLLSEYQISYHLNKTELEIKIGSNEIIFMGLDDPEKIKSAEFNYIWAEEATELSLDDYRQLDLRLRRKTDTVNQIFLSLNPINQLHWIKTELIDKESSDYLDVHHSTFKDNPFLDAHYIRQLEALAHSAPYYYQVYAKGEWGVLENLIYPHFVSYDVIPEGVSEITYGIDWGYEKPAALVEINWIGDKFIWRELIYQSHMIIPEFIDKAKEVVPQEFKSREFFAGTDQPGAIEEFYQAGFNVKNAVTDVADGLLFCRANLLGVTKDSINLIKEIQVYQRKKDKEGNVLEEPVKAFDHGMDAGRYGSYSARRLGEVGGTVIEDQDWYKS